MSGRQLGYNVTSADTIAASDTVGGVVIFSDGTAATYSTISAKKALDVSIANNFEVNGVYNAGTNPNPSNVGLVGVTRSATPAVTGQVNLLTSANPTADGAVAANISALDVNAINMGFNGTTFDRITSTSSALDINIKSQTGTVTVSDAALAKTSMKTTQKSVTATAAAILASQLSARKYLWVQNADKVFLYLGDSTVTSANGIRLAPGSVAEFRLGAAQSLFGVAPTGDTVDTRMFEMS